MTDAERKIWLAGRKLGITSTDAAAIAGVSPWATPADVWLDKRPGAPEIEPSFRMELGLLLEPAIAELYRRQTGRELIKPANLLTHPKRAWQLTSLDYMCRDEQRTVECKSTNERNADQWGTPGTDEIPENYLCQVTHQMCVTGNRITDVAVLIGTEEFRIYTVNYSEATAEMLTEMEHEFWQDHVLAGVCPPLDWGDARTPDLVDRLHIPAGGMMTLDWQAVELANIYADLGQAKKATEEQRDVVKARLVEMLGSCVEGYLPDGRLITRKMIERSAYSVKATTYPDFRIKKSPATKGMVV